LFLFYWELEFFLGTHNTSVETKVLALQPPKHPNSRTPEGNVVAVAVSSRHGQVQRKRA